MIAVVLSLAAYRVVAVVTIGAAYLLACRVLLAQDRRWDRRHPMAVSLDAAARQRVADNERAARRPAPRPAQEGERE